MIKNKRDFSARTEDDREILISEVWCHRCQEYGLGLDEPQEFEGNGIIFLEGRCAACGVTVAAEIVEQQV